MGVKDWLEMSANVASILTAIIAAGAAMYYWTSKRSKRRRLEDYLKGEKSKDPKEFRSTARLMAEFGMTEAEIFAASFSSRRIIRAVRADADTGFAAEVLFQYSDS